MVHISKTMMLTSIENLDLSLIDCGSSSIKNLTPIDPTIGPLNTKESKSVKAVLICHPNSHSFLDRTLVLDKPIKIGRSVGNNKTSVNNGIFDCKVLSRNHALLWFEDGKFYLRDTSSSNGTFVNKERLSKSGEESTPREVFSGDTIQFGVDVTENSRNVTHGCVIATLKLFLPNGCEAKPPTFPLIISSDRNKVTIEDLCVLNQYLNESLLREQMLESKLAAIQTLMKTLRESTEHSWKALISNNNLLSRVELLEVQLKCYSKKFSDDKLREELRNVQEDRNAYEGVVKQYFQKILDEKIAAIQQCQDLNRALDDKMIEFSDMKQSMSNYQKELRELVNQNFSLEKNNKELELKLSMVDKINKETTQKLHSENAMLVDQMRNLTDDGEVLRRTVRDLETQGDYADKKVIALQNQIIDLKNHHSDILCDLTDPSVIKDKIKDVDLVKSLITVYVETIKKCHENTLNIKNNVESLTNDKSAKQQHVSSLESELDKCATQLTHYKREHAELQMKILEKKSEVENNESFTSAPDIFDELYEKGRRHVEDIEEKKKLLNVVERDINLTDENAKELETRLKSARDELMKVSVLYTIEEEKLYLCNNHIENLDKVLMTLNEHFKYLENLVEIKENENDGNTLQNDELRSEFVHFVNIFLQFTRIVSEKLKETENFVKYLNTVPPNEQDDISSDILEVKDKSNQIVEMIGELQEKVETHFEMEREIEKRAETELLTIDDRLRSCLEEKTAIENKYKELLEQYNGIISYPPFFDFYFNLIPVIIILVSVLIFLFFGQQLSFWFSGGK